MNSRISFTTNASLDAQAAQRQESPRPAVQGIAGGIFFLAFFGAYWGFISAAFTNDTFQVVVFFLVGLVTLAFFATAGKILWYARSLPKTSSPEEKAVGRRIAMWFGIIFGTEFLLIALASILLSAFQLDRFLAPVTALIVGIHFFPLARLFRVPMYYLTGVLLSVLALVAMIALLLDLPIAGPSPYNWSLFVGFGTTLVLWLTALYITRFGLKATRLI